MVDGNKEPVSSVVFPNTIKIALLAFIAIMVYALLFSHLLPRIYPTMAASTGYIVLGLLGANFRNRFDWLILFALMGCWLGDLLGPKYFYAGAACFLIAHVFLIAAYLQRGILWKRVLSMALLLLPATAVIILWLLPHVPRHGVPLVLSYVVIITVMVVFSAGASYGPAGRYLLIGSILFFLSDLFLARSQFVIVDALSHVCFPLYYGACVLFALSLWPREPAPEIAE